MKRHSTRAVFSIVLLYFFFLSAKEVVAYKFRVLVAFTSQAVDEGFTPYRAAQGINSIAVQTYENSSPNYPGYQMPEIELAGTVKVSYTGSLVKPAVKALKSKTDGKMDEIHALRDWHMADIVILVHPFTDWGGWAYELEIDDESEAFAVVTPEASALLTPAHEIGHLVGCVHPHEDPMVLWPSVAYAYGYVDPSNTWGTAMSYLANRQGWFSNPYETHNGDPRGIVDSADCTRKHHERKAAIAGYRTTPTIPITLNNIELDSNESIFWDHSQPVYFYGDSEIKGDGLVSLQSAEGVYFLGFPYPYQPIVSWGGTYLKSDQNVWLSGIHDDGSTVIVVADSLLFSYASETVFRSNIANLNANYMRHESGTITIEPMPSDPSGAYILAYARKQIRLTDGVKIKSKNVFLRVSDSYDPSESEWGSVLPKEAVSGRSESSMPAVAAVFQPKVFRTREGLSLELDLPDHGPVSVQAYDLAGRLVASVRKSDARPGLNFVALPGNFRRGNVYLIRIHVSGESHTQRFAFNN